MNKPVRIFFLLAVLVAGILWMTRTTVTYHATCAGCLVRAKGSEIRVLGLTFGKHLEVLPLLNESRLSAVPLPPVEPDIYSEIFGHPCEHHFKRGGMGKSWGGGIGCGSHPEEQAFASRTGAIAALFRLYRRIEHKEYAAESYACIEALLPANAPLKEALYGRGFEPGTRQSQLQTFADMLNLTVTEEEWRRDNSFARAGFLGIPPFLEDHVLLGARLSDRHPEVHRTAALKLMELPSQDRWSVVAQCLDDNDCEVAIAAAFTITGNHRLDLFGKVLRKPPEICNKDYLATSIVDADITGLLDFDDPVIDDLCFDAITRSHRFQFLDLLLSKLNRRESEQTMRAIRTLLDGPKVFDGDGDPWDRIKPLNEPLANLKDIIRVGTASRVRDPRKWLFLDACKSLASGKDADIWDFMSAAYVREVSSGVNETYAAVMARSMAELNTESTNSFLRNEIKLDDHHRLTCAFAAMGLLASPSFVEPITEFQRHPPKRLPGNPYTPEEIFKNPYYAKFIQYALHRCRGIHLQTVRRGQDGRYVLVKK